MKRVHSLFYLALLALLLSVAACGNDGGAADQAPHSALSQEQAATMAENAMRGFQSGDYATWSRDWSAAMKDAIDEGAFLAYREQVLDAVGDFQSVESVTMTPSETEGYVRWVAVVAFEKGRMEFAFAFRQDGTVIEGVFPRALG